MLGSQTIIGSKSKILLPFLLVVTMWHVYICNRKDQLYTGITTDLSHRIRQHKAELLYSEEHPDKHSAASRERQIKGWSRKKKFSLIEKPAVSLP